MMMMVLSGGRVELAGLRLLVVEDMPLIARSIAVILKKNECEVVGPVASVAQGIAAIDAEPELDGALLDINLGNELVYPLAAELKRREIHFAFLTGYARSLVHKKFQDRPLLEKPFARNELEDFLVANFGKKF